MVTFRYLVVSAKVLIHIPGIENHKTVKIFRQRINTLTGLRKLESTCRKLSSVHHLRMEVYHGSHTGTEVIVMAHAEMGSLQGLISDDWEKWTELSGGG